MEIITDLVVKREIYISTNLITPAWNLVPNTTDVVLTTPEAEIWTVKPTNTLGVVQNRPTWISFSEMTFGLPVDPTNAEHTTILDAIATRTKLLFSIITSDDATVFTQFVGNVTSSPDDGTDGGGYVRSITVTPCGSVDYNSATDPRV